MTKFFSFPVYKLEIRSHFRYTLLWGGVISGVVLLLMAFFPSMQSQAMQELSGAKLSGIPDTVLAVLGISKDAFNLTDVLYFFAYVMQFVNMALSVFAALMGIAALIKEETDGSIEFLYARPVTRAQILFSKVLGIFSLLVVLKVIFVLVSLLAFGIFAGNSDWAKNLQNIPRIFLGTLFVETVFMSVGIFCSVLVKDSKRVSSLAVGIVFGTFLLGIISVVSDKLKFMLYFSPLDTVKPNLIIKGEIGIAGLLIGSCVIVASLVFATFMYKKKDYCL